jgi:serine/threonine protein kinase
MTPGSQTREGGQVPHSIRPGDVLADRYTLVDLLSESGGGLFWRAHDRVLSRHVALHVIPSDDERAPHLMEAAKRSAAVVDARILRVLDADERDGQCYVVNEWGSGQSLDNMLDQGPLSPRRAAWIVSEVAAAIAKAHDAGVTHGRLVPENVMIDHNGSVKIIGFAVDAALNGLPPGRRSSDVVDLAALLYAALVGKWPGMSRSRLPIAPMENGHPLRPRKVRAGIPKPLDVICEQVLSPYAPSGSHAALIETAAEIRDALVGFVGDPGPLATGGDTGALPVVPPGRMSPSATPPPADPDATQTLTPPIDPEWRAPRDEPPPPPPDFDQPTPKPLFAEDSVRRPRPMADPPSGSQEYWPWEMGDPAPITGTTERVLEDEPVPGRSWLRLAGIIAAAVLLLLAVTFAFNLGRDKNGTDLPDTAGASDTPSGSEVIAPVKAEDFDPQGDPPEEYPELVKFVLDGDPSTTWHTSTYDQQFGPGGLKDGVGILLDLGESQAVGSVDVGLVGAPTGLELFVTETKPSDVTGLTAAAATTASGQGATLTPTEAVSGRYVLVWLTSLPHPGGFRGRISDIVVHS